MKKIIKKFLILVIAFIPFLSISACGKKSSSDVTGSCEIARTATSSKTFLENGIEEATLLSCTDGDTSNFRTLYSKRTITVRYLSIDTPESTAGYDKWGKAASVFNKSILEKATSVIIEAEGSTAEKDTNGRYLAYVWYKINDSDKYRNLNLEMVENGYSNNNCSTDGKYYSYFEKAEAKAKKEKLHIHGTDDDIYYSEDITNVTLKQLNENPYYDEATGVPTCVSFEAYVIGYENESSSFRTAIVEQYDETEKKYYTYKVDVGYSGTNFYTISSVGSLVKFVGWTTGDGSIHGCSTDFIMQDPLYSVRIKRGYYNKFNNVAIVSASVDSNGVTFVANYDSKEITIKLNDSTITQTQVNSYIGNVTSIECFITDTDNTYTVNMLSDITK